MLDNDNDYSRFDQTDEETLEEAIERNHIEHVNCYCNKHEFNGCHCSNCCICACHDYPYEFHEFRNRVYQDIADEVSEQFEKEILNRE